MLVSSTSMKAAIATTTAINHGLNLGRHTAADAVATIPAVWPVGAVPLLSGLSAIGSKMAIAYAVPLQAWDAFSAKLDSYIGPFFVELGDRQPNGKVPTRGSESPWTCGAPRTAPPPGEKFGEHIAIVQSVKGLNTRHPPSPRPTNVRRSGEEKSSAVGAPS